MNGRGSTSDVQYLRTIVGQRWRDFLMSMPSYWYNPIIGGNAATGQPAMSAGDINASMGLPQAQAAQQQAMASLYGGGSFGAQPAYYAALGASYGRQVPSSA